MKFLDSKSDSHLLLYFLLMTIFVLTVKALSEASPEPNQCDAGLLPLNFCRNDGDGMPTDGSEFKLKSDGSVSVWLDCGAQVLKVFGKVLRPWSKDTALDNFSDLSDKLCNFFLNMLLHSGDEHTFRTLDSGERFVWIFGNACSKP